MTGTPHRHQTDDAAVRAERRPGIHQLHNTVLHLVAMAAIAVIHVVAVAHVTGRVRPGEHHVH